MRNSPLKRIARWPLRHRIVRVGVLVAALLGSGVSAWALITAPGDIAIVTATEGTGITSIGGHMIQSSLTTLVSQGRGAEAFIEAFEHGDELFGVAFNGADGVGAKVGPGTRFTRMPRADRRGMGEWATHVPARATGPNAQSCTGCHNQAADDGSGEAATIVHRDANHTGQLGQMVTRNTPHVFGLGGLQKLAEEMTTEIQGQRAAGRTALGCGTTTTGGTTTRALTSKGINFGSLVITHAAGSTGCSEVLNPPIAGGARAVSADLVVRPFQWKGSVAFVRDFVRGAAHNELGMQGSELLGSPSLDPATVDGDGDGIKNELFVGDITALAIYQAGQARPTTRKELSALGLISDFTPTEDAAITRGSAEFDRMGCATCHTRQLLVNDVIYREPSNHPAFRDPGNVFPNGRAYGLSQLDIMRPVSFDITRDHPENADVRTANGQGLGDFVRDAQGRAVIALFGDLRRHDMGPGLAEEVDEVGTGRSVFMTENLWGVGSSAPYLHDGRAGSLSEAILEHGGEAQGSRNLFASSTTNQRKDLITFLKNQVIFKTEE